MMSIFLNLMYLLATILAIFSVVLLFAVSICVLLLWNRHRHYNHIPGPKRTSFFYGNASELTDNKGRLLCEILLDHALTYGPVFIWWYFFSPLVVISSPEFIKHGIVTLNLPKAPSMYNGIAYLFGRYRFTGSGLFTQLDHDKWRHQKRLLSPAFHRGYLKGLVPQFNSVASSLVTKLMDIADGKTVVDMADEFQKTTLDVIGKVAFNLELKCLEDNSSVPNCLYKCLEGYEESYLDPFLSLPFYKHSYQKNVQKSLSFLRNLARESIERRKEAMESCQPHPNDIMGMILQASQLDRDVNMEDLVDEFITFFVAGQDTTANQLSFALLEILLNGRIENSIFQEVDHVLGNKDTVEYDDISNLQYVRQTLKESLRKHPPAGGMLRTTTKPEKFGSFQIPKGAIIDFSIYVAHHLPENWCDPECFNPDRFLGENNSENKISNFVYFPFSCGPRTCIGKDFSSINASILIAQLFQKFKFELVAGQTLQREEKLTMRPKGGVLCTIKRRSTRAYQQ